MASTSLFRYFSPSEPKYRDPEGLTTRSANLLYLNNNLLLIAKLRWFYRTESLRALKRFAYNNNRTAIGHDKQVT